MALSIGPRSGSQFGGTAIYISGPCFHENDTILCFFDGDYRTSGYYVSNTTAICVSPRFETPGWKSLFVQKIRNQAEENSTSGRSQFYAGICINDSLQLGICQCSVCMAPNN